MKQVDASVYRFEKYAGEDRWGSYWYQIKEALSLNPTSVLEVGAGKSPLGGFLKDRGIAYTSVDVAEDLKPDVVAEVTALPFKDGEFDVVCAFEVLEHLPFKQFETALTELARVSRKGVVLSLPHFGPSLRLELKLPLLSRLRLAWKVPIPRTHRFDGEHYWEIGKRGYPLSRVRIALKRYFNIEREYIPFENQYHRFFVLTKNL